MARPAQGQQKNVKPTRPAYRADAAPRRVSRGSVSKPVPLPSWRLGRIVADAAPKRVKR